MGRSLEGKSNKLYNEYREAESLTVKEISSFLPTQFEIVNLNRKHPWKAIFIPEECYPEIDDNDSKNRIIAQEKYDQICQEKWITDKTIRPELERIFNQHDVYVSKYDENQNMLREHTFIKTSENKVEIDYPFISLLTAIWITSLLISVLILWISHKNNLPSV